MPRTPAPAPPIVGDVVRLIPSITSDSQFLQFSQDYMSSAFYAGLGPELIAIAGQWAASLPAVLKAVLPADATYLGLTVVAMSRADVQSAFDATGNGVGTVMTTHLPLEMSARLRKQSILKGAHGRGASLVGPVATTFVTPATSANQLNAAGILAMNALGAYLNTALVSALSGNTYTPCISTRPPTGTTLVGHAQVQVSSKVVNLLSTARRRRPGRGV